MHYSTSKNCMARRDLTLPAAKSLAGTNGYQHQGTIDEDKQTRKLWSTTVHWRPSWQSGTHERATDGSARLMT
jgi:hypothetical protein